MDIYIAHYPPIVGCSKRMERKKHQMKGNKRKKKLLKIWAQFHGSAYRRQIIGAYGSMEFCAYVKRISRVSGEFWLVRVRTPHSTLTANAEIRRLHVSGEL